MAKCGIRDIRLHNFSIIHGTQTVWMASIYYWHGIFMIIQSSLSIFCSSTTSTTLSILNSSVGGKRWMAIFLFYWWRGSYICCLKAYLRRASNWRWWPQALAFFKTCWEDLKVSFLMYSMSSMLKPSLHKPSMPPSSPLSSRWSG